MNEEQLRCWDEMLLRLFETTKLAADLDKALREMEAEDKALHEKEGEDEK